MLAGLVRPHRSIRRPTVPEILSVSTPYNSQGSLIPVPVDPTTFSYNTKTNAAGHGTITIQGPAYSLFRADQSTLAAPASSTYSRPAAPTLSQVAGGALGARTYFVRVAYVKNFQNSRGAGNPDFCIYRMSLESSIAVSANNLLKITSPASVAGYDGWLIFISNGTNTEVMEVLGTGIPHPFGTDVTEAVGGFITTGRDIYISQMDTGITVAGLIANQPYVLYVYFDPTVDTPAGGAYRIAGAVSVGLPTVKNDSAAAEQNGDGRYPMSVGATLNVTTDVVSGGGGSGTGSSGGSKFR